MINSKQFRQLVVRKALMYLDPVIPYSVAAENLLMGTCAKESDMGTFIAQNGGGPALGVFQMEPATYNDIFNNFIKYKKDLKSIVLFANSPEPEEMVCNMFFAAIMCRIHYYRRPEALPAPYDFEALGQYWKQHYNTVKGKGTVEEFVENYHRYVKK